MGGGGEKVSESDSTIGGEYSIAVEKTLPLTFELTNSQVGLQISSSSHLFSFLPLLDGRRRRLCILCVSPASSCEKKKRRSSNNNRMNKHVGGGGGGFE